MQKLQMQKKLALRCLKTKKIPQKTGAIMLFPLCSLLSSESASRETKQAVSHQETYADAKKVLLSVTLNCILVLNDAVFLCLNRSCYAK